MCTTIGFSYNEGAIAGRTLEVGTPLDNHVTYIPKNYQGLIPTLDGDLASKYAVLGTGFFHLNSFGDGINEMGLMGSNNLLPGVASYATEQETGKINLTIASAFSYLLSRCKDVAEVRIEAKKLCVVAEGVSKEDVSTDQHFYFMDTTGDCIVLEPVHGKLVVYDNPFAVLTNAPEFPWHVTNLRNYIHLQPENIQETSWNGETLTKFGEGSGMVGLPGDFTPPSRFVRAASFVSNTPKNLERQDAILQGFRILSQSDIPTGAVTDAASGHRDETLYTAIMDTKSKGYFVKTHGHLNIQAFYMKEYQDSQEIIFLELEKSMNL